MESKWAKNKKLVIFQGAWDLKVIQAWKTFRKVAENDKIRCFFFHSPNKRNLEFVRIQTYTWQNGDVSCMFLIQLFASLWSLSALCHFSWASCTLPCFPFFQTWAVKVDLGCAVCCSACSESLSPFWCYLCCVVALSLIWGHHLWLAIGLWDWGVDLQLGYHIWLVNQLFMWKHSGPPLHISKKGLSLRPATQGPFYNIL